MALQRIDLCTSKPPSSPSFSFGKIHKVAYIVSPPPNKDLWSKVFVKLAVLIRLPISLCGR